MHILEYNKQLIIQYVLYEHECNTALSSSTVDVKIKYENLKQKQCLKRACSTQEQHIHSVQQMLHEKLFDKKTETRRSISLVSTEAQC